MRDASPSLVFAVLRPGPRRRTSRCRAENQLLTRLDHALGAAQQPGPDRALRPALRRRAVSHAGCCPRRLPSLPTDNTQEDLMAADDGITRPDPNRSTGRSRARHARLSRSHRQPDHDRRAAVGGHQGPHGGDHVRELQAFHRPGRGRRAAVPRRRGVPDAEDRHAGVAAARGRRVVRPSGAEPVRQRRSSRRSSSTLSPPLQVRPSTGYAFPTIPADPNDATDVTNLRDEYLATLEGDLKVLPYHKLIVDSLGALPLKKAQIVFGDYGISAGAAVPARDAGADLVLLARGRHARPVDERDLAPLSEPPHDSGAARIRCSAWRSTRCAR